MNGQGPLRAIAAPRLFDGERLRADAFLVYRGARVVAVAEHAPETAEVERLPPGALLAPGFIDVQVNGGGGVLLNDAPTLDSIAAIAAAHRRLGVTGLLPTLITDAPAKMAALADVAARAVAVPGVLGLHLEGPFLGAARRGAHRADLLRAPEEGDFALLARFAGAGRSQVTLAPEIVGPDAVRRIVDLGLRVSIGHSDASAPEVFAAADAGASGVTHLYNAMSLTAPRAPGIVGAALDDSRLFCGIICDGLHVDPVNLRLALRAAGRDRLMLVSDAMPTVGSSITEFDLMGRKVARVGDRLQLSDGTLAGAHLDMAGAVRTAIADMGASLADALIMASRTPARFLGLDDARGRLAPGFFADLVALDADLRPFATWIAGARSP